MKKVSASDSEAVYRHGTRFGLLFVILIPVAIAAKLVLEIEWLPVIVMVFMGVVMLFVGGMREQVAFDYLTRTITCSKSFFARELSGESIPFSKVTRISVGPNFQRDDKPNGQTYQSGFRMMIDWNAEWGGGGMMLDTFGTEEQAMSEAEELARRIGTRMVRGEVDPVSGRVEG